jgi:site-specific DNA-methyltransferase (adenine-specific)
VRPRNARDTPRAKERGKKVSAILGPALWTVIDGDCLSVLPMLTDQSVAHVITDPPYEAEAHTRARRRRLCSVNRVAGVGDYAIGFDAIDPETRRTAGSEFSRLSRRWSLVFCQVEAAMLWREAIGPDRYVRTMVWDKPDATPQLTGDRPAQGYESIVVSHGSEKKRWNAGGRRGVYRHCVNPPIRTHEHATEKPVSLMLELISDFTDPGDVILDPFCGSGTTGIAAIRLGRRFIGIEKDPTYVALARERVAAEEQGSTLQAVRAGQEALFR